MTSKIEIRYMPKHVNIHYDHSKYSFTLHLFIHCTLIQCIWRQTFLRGSLGFSIMPEDTLAHGLGETQEWNPVWLVTNLLPLLSHSRPQQTDTGVQCMWWWLSLSPLWFVAARLLSGSWLKAAACPPPPPSSSTCISLMSAKSKSIKDPLPLSLCWLLPLSQSLCSYPRPCLTLSPHRPHTSSPRLIVRDR